MKKIKLIIRIFFSISLVFPSTVYVWKDIIDYPWIVIAIGITASIGIWDLLRWILED